MSVVAVVALGKMGLPLAVHYARCGHTVVGCDIEPAVVAEVSAGRCPVVGEAGLEAELAQAVRTGKLRATTDVTAGVADADVVVMIPPLKLADATPDYAAVDAATRAVAAGLKPGVLVVYETTVPVGDTRHRFTPMLETGSSLRAGHTLFVAFSPERVYMGRIFADLARYPKIVGGVDQPSTDRAVAFYRTVITADVVPVASAETAEFVKLAETTYRDVNIALANELAVAATRLGVDAPHAFELANTQPFSHLHSPGAGVGGHCIPVYPRLLLQSAPELTLPRVAREVNDRMPAVLVQALRDELGELAGRRVVVMGLSYRADVREATLSPARSLISLLRANDVDTYVCDPYFSAKELAESGATPISPDVVTADATIVITKHTAFRDVDLSAAGLLVDGRPDGWPLPVAPDQRVYVTGRGWLAPGRGYQPRESPYEGSRPID